MGSACCSSDDSELQHTLNVDGTKNRYRKTPGPEEFAELARKRIQSSSSASDSDDSNVSARATSDRNPVKNNKKKTKKKPKSVPLELDESYIDSEVSHEQEPLYASGAVFTESTTDMALDAAMQGITLDNGNDLIGVETHTHAHDIHSRCFGGIYELRVNHVDGLTKDEELFMFAYRVYQNVEIKDRTYHTRRWPQCFVGEEAVNWMMQSGVCVSRNHAILKGEQLIHYNIINHVAEDHGFEDSALFYRFVDKNIFFKDADKKYGEIIRKLEQIEHKRIVDELIRDLVPVCKSNFDVKDRKFHMKTYRNCFVAETAIDWLVESGKACGRSESIEVLQMMMDRAYIKHVGKAQRFRDGGRFWEFIR